MLSNTNAKQCEFKGMIILSNAPPISKNDISIYRCVRASLTAYTLLLSKLNPATTLEEAILKQLTRFDQCEGFELPLTNISSIFFLEIDDRNKYLGKR